MPKRRLRDIAEELGMSFEEAADQVFKHLSEEMISGKGRALWVTEEGQAVLDDITPMPTIYRGPILGLAPNPLYVMVRIRELGRKVPVKIPARMRSYLKIGKMVYVKFELNNGCEQFEYLNKP